MFINTVSAKIDYSTFYRIRPIKVMCLCISVALPGPIQEGSYISLLIAFSSFTNYEMKFMTFSELVR